MARPVESLNPAGKCFWEPQPPPREGKTSPIFAFLGLDLPRFAWSNSKVVRYGGYRPPLQSGVPLHRGRISTLIRIDYRGIPRREMRGARHGAQDGQADLSDFPYPRILPGGADFSFLQDVKELGLPNGKAMLTRSKGEGCLYE